MDTKLCRGCNEELPVESFRTKFKIRKGQRYPYLNSKCRPCENEWNKQRRTTPKYRAYRAKWREGKRGNLKIFLQDRIAGWRTKLDLPSDLTVDYLLQLYARQDGACYYSGMKMEFNSRGGPNDHTMSLDRLCPDKGYIQDNVVWCAYLVNTMKQTMSEQEFYSFLEHILAWSKR